MLSLHFSNSRFKNELQLRFQAIQFDGNNPEYFIEIFFLLQHVRVERK